MDINCTADLAEMRPTVRRFVSERLEPIARQIDATGEVPAEAIVELRSQGYLGMLLPADVGGGDFDLSTYCLVMEEVARSHRVFTLMLDASSGLTPIAISRFGTPKKNKKKEVRTGKKR